MAPRQAAAHTAAAEESSEREYQATLNAAVAATEDEIFRDALGEEELDNDGDTSLEEMGDGLEGEAEEGEADEEGEEGEDLEAQGEDGEDAEVAEDEGDGGGGEDAGADRDRQGRFQGQDDRRVPSGVLREEKERRRQLEQTVAEYNTRMAEMSGRMAEMSARLNAPPPRPAAEVQPPPKPDMFADPVAYENWVLAEAERKAEAKIDQRFSNFEQRQQQREIQRVDRNLEATARGPRAFEFSAAYNALTSLDPRDRNAQAVVAGICNAPDPGKALFDWWDANGGPEYRDQILNQLLPEDQRPANRGNGRNGTPQANRGGRQQQQIRHEIRPPQRLPSLNSATGSNSQRMSDPEMLDGSEASIFRYGTAR